MIEEIIVDELLKQVAKKAIKKTIAKQAVKKAAVAIAESRSKSLARKIIEKGIQDVKALEKVATEGDVTFRTEVRLADVKKAIEKFPTKQRYTEKELATLKKQFNVNRLKSNTFQYIDLNVERVVMGDSIIDQPFTQTYTIGTVSESALTKVQNMGKELNKMLKGYNSISEGSKEQLMRTLSKLPDNLIKDSIDLSKGINISQLKESDAKTLITALQQASEIADLPRNTSARQAVAKWEDEMADGAFDDEDYYDFDDEGNYDRNTPISYVTIHDELTRMYDRLAYNSALEEKPTNIAFYEWRDKMLNDNGNQSVKNKVTRELLQLIKTNVKPSPNIRGSVKVPEYHGGAIMPDLIRDKTAEMMERLMSAKAEKMSQLRRG